MISETGFTQYKPGDQIGGAYSVAKVFGGKGGFYEGGEGLG